VNEENIPNMDPESNQLVTQFIKDEKVSEIPNDNEDNNEPVIMGKILYDMHNDVN